MGARRVPLLLTLLTLCQLGNGADIGKYFTRSPQNIVAPPGDRVSFQCEMNIGQVDRVRWKLNGIFLDPGSDPDLKTSGNILYVKVKKGQEEYRSQIGDYQCVSAFGGEALTSLPATLSIAHMEPQSRGGGRNWTYEVVEGNRVAIPCDVPGSNPPPIYEFFKNGAPVLPEPRNSLLLDTSGFLHLENVSFQDSGLYWCRASNHITSETRDSTSIVRLSVVKARSSPPQAPKFLLKPRQFYSVQIGGNVTLECVAVGNPVPVTSWRKLGSHSLWPTGGNLLLTNVTLTDEGGYVCEAHNGVGAQITIQSVVVISIPPEIRKEPQSLVAEEGTEAHLDCVAEGLPKPRVFWLFNGQKVTEGGNIKITDWGLNITAVEKRHAGLFQCFANNPLGTVTSPAELKVLPKQITANESGYSDPERSRSQESYGNSGEKEPHHKEQSYHNRRKHHHGRKKHKHGQGQEMEPPSIPQVNRISEDSIMLRWTVPPSGRYPIQFFKVQYKEVSKRHSRWVTIDDDIAPHITSFEIPDLKIGSTYKFRIAAVYSNHDNKVGPNSDKFLLRKDIERRPAFTPVILSAIPFNNSAIKLTWKYLRSDMEGIEGFFIYYRESTSAGEYSKVTVLDRQETGIISHLKEATAYDIKLQAFNHAGASAFSQIIAAKTSGVSKLDVPHFEEDPGVLRKDIEIPDEPPPSSDSLYLLLGAIFAAFWVFLCIACAVCYKCKQRRVEAEVKYPSSRRGGSPQLDKQLPTVVNGRVIMNGHIRSDGGAFISALTSHLDLENKAVAAETSFMTEKPRNLESVGPDLSLSSFRSNSLERSPWKSTALKNNNVNLNNTRSLGRDKWVEKSKRAAYMSCSSGDEDGEGKDTRIFPKEHYKMNRRGNKRIPSTGSSGSGSLKIRAATIDNRRLNLKFTD